MNTNEINTKIYASSPESLISFMEHSNDHWFIKDKCSRYIYMNDSSLNYFNYPKGFDVEGREDKDIPLESSQELWPELVAHDQKTMEQNKTITSLEVHYYGPGNIDTPIPHLCDKTPLYDKENNCLGVVCRGTALDAPGLLYYMNRFNRKTIQFDAPNNLFTQRELDK